MASEGGRSGRFVFFDLPSFGLFAEASLELESWTACGPCARGGRGGAPSARHFPARSLGYA